MNGTLLWNSLAIAGGTAALATGAGLCSALFAVTLGRRLQRLMVFAATAALALPPFLVVNTWLSLSGTATPVQPSSWLNLFSLPGVLFVLTLMLWPVPFLAAWSVLHRMDSSLLACDLAVRGATLIRALLIPLVRPALLLAGGIVFVLAFNNFAVPALLQQKVLPAEIWVRFNTQFDAPGALRLSWPLLAVPLALLLLLGHREFPLPDRRRYAEPALIAQQLGPVWRAGTGILALLVLGASLALPLSHLVFAPRTWVELPDALAANADELWSSFFFSVVTASLVIGLGLLPGWRREPRSLSGIGPGRVFGAVLWMGFLVPGVLLGIGLITLFNRPATSAFYSSSMLVLLALVLRYLVVGWQTAAFAARRANPRLVDAARLDGAGRWQIFRRVLWPQAAPQVLIGAYIVYLLCLWDVETILLVTPPGTQTAAISVFNLLHYGHNVHVNALCLALLALGVGPLLLFRVWHYRPFRRFAALSVLVLLAALANGCAPERNPSASTFRSSFFSEVEIIGSRGVGAGQFNKPRSLTVDREGNIYVADLTGRVQKLTPAGEYVWARQLPQTDLGKPKGMCRGADGEILVVEPHYQRVNHFSTAGELLYHWGRRGTDPGEFTLPRAVAVNSDGEMYVSEYAAAERIQVFGNRGRELLRSFGRAGRGPGEFNRPEGLCVDARDQVYVADSCNHRVQVFTRRGEFIRTYGQAGSGPGELSYPYDICVDPDGYQYVCEFGNSRIQVFDPAGKSVEIIGGVGNAPGRFFNPWSIALDPAGNLYVADSLNHRVQKFVRRTPLPAKAT